MKVNYIYKLYTQKVQEYLENGFIIAPMNVSIGGVDSHVKLVKDGVYFSIRITSEFLNSLSESPLHELDKKLSLKVILFDRSGQDFEDEGRILYQQDYYVLGDLLYTSTEAQKVNRRIHDKRVQRFGNGNPYKGYEISFKTGKLSHNGFKRGINKVTTWVDIYGNKHRKITNSLTNKSIQF